LSVDLGVAGAERLTVIQFYRFVFLRELFVSFVVNGFAEALTTKVHEGIQSLSWFG